MSQENIDIQRHILKKLYKIRAMGAKHFRIDNLVSGVPSHVRGTLKKEIENLIRKDYIRLYNRSKGALHLNLDKLPEILEFLEQTREANP